MNNESLQKINIFFSQFEQFHYKKRDTIIYAGDPLHNVYYIKNGFVRVYRISEQGEELTLTILKSNDFFPITWGMNNLFDNCYFEALTPVEVWRAPQEKFKTFISAHHDVFYEMTGYVMTRFGGLLARMEYLVFGNAYTKIASTLLVCAKRFGERQGEDVVVKLPLTHKDIATFVGITRETTCLEMKKLERKGVISHRGRLLVVKNLKRLEEESLHSENDNWLLDNSI